MEGREEGRTIKGRNQRKDGKSDETTNQPTPGYRAFQGRAGLPAPAASLLSTPSLSFLTPLPVLNWRKNSEKRQPHKKRDGICKESTSSTFNSNL